MLRQLIECFLEINPTPSDAQVHSLADALGVDKETLEAEMYEMLGECQDNGSSGMAENDYRFSPIRASFRLFATSVGERVLQDDYDAQKTPYQDLLLNDSAVSIDLAERNQEVQDALRDDGLVDTLLEDDEQELLKDDGVPIQPLL